MALVIVPIADPLLRGSRAGTARSVIVTGLLIGDATSFPFDERQRPAVWLTAVTAGGRRPGRHSHRARPRAGGTQR